MTLGSNYNLGSALQSRYKLETSAKRPIIELAGGIECRLLLGAGTFFA